MPYRIDQPLPRIVELGRAATLPLPIRSDANAAQTLVSATLTVRLGSTILLDAVAATTLGPPASYSLLAATTTDLSPSDEWLESWATDLGVFTYSGYLVRSAYHSHVTDSALQQLHPEFLGFLPPGETTGEKFRVAATEQIQRDLIKKGRRPWLIFDEWALYDAERYFAMHLWANDRAVSTSGDSDYARLAADYLEKYRAEWGTVSFRYDLDEDGAIDEDETETASPGGITLTAGRPRRTLLVAA
jgi:hypothetical protein